MSEDAMSDRHWLEHADRERDELARERDYRYEQWRASESECARYRKALAEIVAVPRPQLQGDRTWREIALEALRDAPS